jgi:branched-chain amino acid transport system substrate-binding protein
MKALSVVSLLCATVGTVQAQYSDGVIRIGVLNDQSGLYADLTGQGSVWAAKKAIADLCNAAACH